MRSTKQPKRCANIRSLGKPPQQNCNDENDKFGVNSNQNQRKPILLKNPMPFQGSLKQRTSSNQNSLSSDLKQLKFMLEKKQVDQSQNIKKSFQSEKLNGNQFQLQNNLDTLSQILQTQKKVVKQEDYTRQGTSFFQDESRERVNSKSKTLEIKTDLFNQMNQIPKNQKPINPHSVKEKSYTEIPKYLYGLTCETKASLTPATPEEKGRISFKGSNANNVAGDKNPSQTNKDESNNIPSNVLLEKRSGGDYFKFDFKNQKKQFQLQFQDNLKFFLSDKNQQCKTDENEKEKVVTPIKIKTKDKITDTLIEDTNGFCEEFSRDFCQDISYLNQQVVEDIDDTSKTEKFKEQYKVGSRVGQGAYAAVRMAIQLKTNKRVAIKIYEKVKIKDLQRRKGVRREIKLLQKLSHQNIVKIIDTVESNNHINIILEFVGGNSLHSYIKRQQEKRLTEDQCRPLFQQIVLAIQYMHSKSICHRDIKLENILLDESYTVAQYIKYKVPKLIDLGFSTCFPLDRKVKMFCGTPSYMAPEIVSRQEYRGDKADIWALGVVFFALLQGFFPFKGTSDSELYKKIQSGIFETSVQISDQSQNLISQILSVDPEQRPTATEILKHPWLKMTKKYRPQIAEITLEQDKDSSKPINPEDFFKNISFITPTNQQKLFEFGTQPRVQSQYLQNQTMNNHLGVYSPFSQKQTDINQQIDRIKYYTTTNAMLQQKMNNNVNNNPLDLNNQYFFKAQQNSSNQLQNTGRKSAKTQPENGRQKTHSYCLNSGLDLQDQQDHYGKPSYDSNSEIGQLLTNIQMDKKKHLLTIYPSYVPSDKSFASIRSPSNDMIAKLQQKSRELSRERSKENNRAISQPRQPLMDYNQERIRMQVFYE